VTVKEADGSNQVFTVPYSSVPILQREGYTRYSLTAGEYEVVIINKQILTFPGGLCGACHTVGRFMVAHN
jgi:hypothetical protein